MPPLQALDTSALAARAARNERTGARGSAEQMFGAKQQVLHEKQGY